ncbi:MAG: hypothetical protein ACREBU_16605, partial [Nitrososphaera sp.]
EITVDINIEIYDLGDVLEIVVETNNMEWVTFRIMTEDEELIEEWGAPPDDGGTLSQSVTLFKSIYKAGEDYLLEVRQGPREKILEFSVADESAEENIVLFAETDEIKYEADVPEVPDESDEVISAMNTNTNLKIKTSFANKKVEIQEVTAIFQIKDKKGIVHHVAWSAGSVPPSLSMDFVASWLPVIPDDYTIEVFFWTNLVNPEQLSEKIFTVITIGAPCSDESASSSTTSDFSVPNYEGTLFPGTKDKPVRDQPGTQGWDTNGDGTEDTTRRTTEDKDGKTVFTTDNPTTRTVKQTYNKNGEMLIQETKVMEDGKWRERWETYSYDVCGNLIKKTVYETYDGKVTKDYTESKTSDGKIERTGALH